MNFNKCGIIGYKQKKYDTLFVKGQQLYKHRYHILKFLDLPINSHWITNHKRNSDWFSSNKKEREGLYNIYGGFNDFILSQPDIQIQKKYIRSYTFINIRYTKFEDQKSEYIMLLHYCKKNIYII